jgi:hypothetical protein
MIGTNFFHNLWRFACFIFLVLVCCGQVYQSDHLHHSHNNDSVVFEVSTHPLDIAVEHSSAHQHQEEKSSQQDGNEHNYKTKVDWNVARSKSVIKGPFEAQALFTPAYTPPFVDFGEAPSWHQAPSCKTEQYVSFLIIRGPPQLV